MSIDPRESRRMFLLNAYQKAGEGFMASELLADIFRDIRTEEDKIKHNVAFDRICVLIGDDERRERGNGQIYSALLNAVATEIFRTANMPKTETKGTV